ncbi:MAG: tRNA lysidine(34) synthetase TilS [Desulfopila sp.]|nr:tRNA lysidine(34) synthetase TilS [Desulfopila sp.]
MGCSGGPDSTALLALLAACDLQLKLIAVYVDHSLRPEESEKEKIHLQTLAASLQTEYTSLTVDALSHKLREKSSLEESCRILRYRALERCRVEFEADVIAVGHTADDQAEEILLRLFRGTGLKGLSGMLLQNKQIIRPLLGCTKEELLNYLDDAAISYCIDSSNSDCVFLRNRLRHEILPLLEKHFNQALRPTLLRTAAILREENDLLEEISATAYSTCVTRSDSGAGDLSSATIALDAFLGLHPAIQRRVLEKVCWDFESPPDFDHINTICQVAKQGRNGAETHLPKGLRLYKNSTTLDFYKVKGAKNIRGQLHQTDLLPVSIDGPGRVCIKQLDAQLVISSLDTVPEKLPEGSLLLDADTTNFPLLLRSPQPGERFTPSGMEGRKKVTRFLADCRIAKAKRRLHPVLLAANGEVAAVLGLRADARFSPTPMTTKLLLISWEVTQHTKLSP